MENATIQKRLIEHFGNQVYDFGEQYGILNFSCYAALNLKVLQFLYDESLSFQFLTDICAVHFPDRKDEEICVVYHMHNLVANKRLRMKIYLSETQPEVYTATQLFASANWMERETYDFFGVRFVGHPNLKRILNVDEIDYFPLRKEFPLEDQTRLDKDDEMFGRDALAHS